MILVQADILIRNFDRFHNSWTTFLRPLRLGSYMSDGNYHRTWHDNCRPILESIIKALESYRNEPGWRDNAHRNPSFFPSIFELRLALLPKPEDREHVEVAKTVLKLLQDITTTGKPYHHELDRIKSEVLLNRSVTSQVDVALDLGELPNEAIDPSTVDYLRIELAHWLLRKIERGTSVGLRTMLAHLEKSEAMLAQWRSSNVKEFRMRGCIGFEEVNWGSFD